MVISQNMLKNFISPEKNIKGITLQHITEVESFKNFDNDPNIVVGFIRNIKDHPNSDRLKICEVDVGLEKLQIICGAKNVKNNIFVIVAKIGSLLQGKFKIKKANIRGIESHGMICSLNELGIDEKFIEEEFKDGIYIISERCEVGESALKRLSMTGFKMELGLTPNRGDLLSVLGYAYDLSAITNQKVNLPNISLEDHLKKSDITVSIESDKCLKYHARILKNVNIKESPWWLKEVLILNNIRPINNIVDITNYILIMYGTPLHTFDYDKFNGNEILVRNAKDGEKTKSLDGIERPLNNDDLVITENNRIIAIAGVMGSENTMISDKTNNIVLEAAYFDPESIRKTSKKLDLISESSVRFERGISYSRVDLGLNVATKLLIDLADADIFSGISTCVKNEYKAKKIEISEKYISKKIGKIFSKKEILNILYRLGYEIEEKNDKLICSPPDYRHDINEKIDLVEEIARVYGIDKLPAIPVQANYDGGLKYEQKRKRVLRNALSNLGFNEVVTYTLVDKNTKIDFPSFGNEVTVLMPMREDRSILRQSMYPGMLDVMEYNTKRKQDNIFLYEIGNVFSKKEEFEEISIIVKGKFNNNLLSKNNSDVDFFFIKAVLKRIGFILNVDLSIQESNGEEVYHPYQQAKIYFENEVVGHMGTFNPRLIIKYDLKKVFGLTIKLSKILEKKKNMTFKNISKFPSISRDLSIIYPIDKSVKNLTDMISNTVKENLVEVKVFDVYKGESIQNGFKSISLRMTFNDSKKTLETSDVEKWMKKISHRLTHELGATLRG